MTKPLSSTNWIVNLLILLSHGVYEERNIVIWVIYRVFGTELLVVVRRIVALMVFMQRFSRDVLPCRHLLD